MIQLSKRLQLIASFVTERSVVADIGSDHALLPVYLIQQGVIDHAIAGELNEGPFQAARRQVSASHLAERLDVRHGDGLEVIQTGEVDLVTIAGMGGHVMTDILTRGERVLEQVKRIVLQPNVAEDHVRRWLKDNDWYLVAECMIEEDGIIYIVLVADRPQHTMDENSTLYEPRVINARVKLTTDRLFEMGPHFTREATDLFFKKWEMELRKRTHIAAQMASSPAAAEKRAKWLAEIEEIKEVLQCLRTAKP